MTDVERHLKQDCLRVPKGGGGRGVSEHPAGTRNLGPAQVSNVAGGTLDTNGACTLDTGRACRLEVAPPHNPQYARTMFDLHTCATACISQSIAVRGILGIIIISTVIITSIIVILIIFIISRSIIGIRFGIMSSSMSPLSPHPPTHPPVPPKKPTIRVFPQTANRSASQNNSSFVHKSDMWCVCVCVSPSHIMLIILVCSLR